jgi:hypothetical protein
MYERNKREIREREKETGKWEEERGGRGWMLRREGRRERNRDEMGTSR